MAALGALDVAARDDRLGQARPVSRTRVGRLRWWRLGILAPAGLFFLVPLIAAVRFCIDTTGGGHSLTAFTSLVGQQGFGPSVWLSLRLGAVTLAISLALMVPTALYVHLRLPRLRRTMDGVTVLPIVIAPIILITGVLSVAPSWLKATPYLLALEYAVLAMPFMYRSLDAGLRAMDLATLVDAARSLGSRWITTMLRVLVPNLRAAIISGSVLTVALVFAEYTMATLDQYQNFSVWIYVFSQSSAQVSVAASLFGLLLPWALLFGISFLATAKPGRLRHRRLDVTGGGQ